MISDKQEVRIDTRGLTFGQLATVAELKTLLESPSVTKLVIWNESNEEYGDATKPEMGVEVVDDGKVAIGYFDEIGQLKGDWIC
jgi:hypothetical protein